MNPARTIGPAIANASYKGIWVYMVGPVVGALLGAFVYEIIRESDEPLRIRSNDEEYVNNNPLEVV